MKNRDSNGYRLFSFRAGDRSEYLAIYALTRIAFVTPVPRQEDFGIVDFHCVLTQKRGNEVIPTGAFSVQVKSGASKLMVNNKKIKWMSTNMDCPLFLCAVDKINAKRDEPRIRLFSCLNIWSALFFRMDPQSITLFPGRTGPNGVPYQHYPGTTGNEHFDIEGRFDVFLGRPVIDMGLSEFEQKADLVFDVLNAWIRLDRINVALMRLGRAATFDFEVTEPNQLPTRTKEPKVFSREDVNQHGLLDKIRPLLESLRRSYKRIQNLDRVDQIQTLMDSFEGDAAISPKTALERLLIE
jgi:hypothetical protein